MEKYIQCDFKLPSDFKPSLELEKYILKLPFPTFRVFIPEDKFKEIEKIIIDIINGK